MISQTSLNSWKIWWRSSKSLSWKSSLKSPNLKSRTICLNTWETLKNLIFLNSPWIQNSCPRQVLRKDWVRSSQKTRWIQKLGLSKKKQRGKKIWFARRLSLMRVEFSLFLRWEIWFLRRRKVNKLSTMKLMRWMGALKLKFHPRRNSLFENLSRIASIVLP